MSTSTNAQLFERAQKLARGFAYFSIEYIPREQNREADRLANKALDGTGRAGATENEIRKSKFETRKIRARYTNGALIPAEAIDLPDDSEVEITIHPDHPASIAMGHNTGYYEITHLVSGKTLKTFHKDDEWKVK